LRAFATDRHISGKINTHLARWCRAEGLEPFTFYAARKTWATLARNKAGIDKATVDECLCHRGDLRLADIYIERDWGLLDAANARVLDLLRWEGAFR
jgi:integrase